jgi:hypothetical protein
MDPLGVRQTDYFRCSGHAPRAAPRTPGYKEWHHFIVYAPGLRLLVNFNLTEPRHDGARRRSAQGQPLAGRLIMIAETTEWCGDLEAFAPSDVAVVPGGLSARFGENAMWFEDGAYNVRAKLANQPLAANLKLTPVTEPILSSHIQLVPGHELSWLILPRLKVSGSVSLGGRHVNLKGGLAYHDHNWGHFDWGDDFAWEWGSMVPRRASNPWTAVYVRMANRSRTSVGTQGLFVWDGERHCRFFRDEDLQVTLEGRQSMTVLHKVPHIMGLLAPGTCTDVPQRLVAFGDVGGDQVLMTFNTLNVSQVVIPDETNTNSVTLLNEATGSLDLTGTIGGRSVEMEGSGVFEFIRA